MRGADRLQQLHIRKVRQRQRIKFPTGQNNFERKAFATRAEMLEYYYAIRIIKRGVVKYTEQAVGMEYVVAWPKRQLESRRVKAV